MGRSGRFGKYGEVKRLARLKQKRKNTNSRRPLKKILDSSKIKKPLNP